LKEASTSDELSVALADLFAPLYEDICTELLNEKQGQKTADFTQVTADLARQYWVPLPTQYCFVSTIIRNVSDKHISYVSQK
jgi:hypothetical protein